MLSTRLLYAANLLKRQIMLHELCALLLLEDTANSSLRSHNRAPLLEPISVRHLSMHGAILSACFFCF